jgi:hypothetical protein
MRDVTDAPLETMIVTRRVASRDNLHHAPGSSILNLHTKIRIPDTTSSAGQAVRRRARQ